MKRTLTAAAVLMAAMTFGTYSAFSAEPAMVADSSAGKIWVDPLGMTLYTFDKDTATKSNCNGDCAVEWPPLAVTKDAKAEGEWTIVTRDDGSQMWAYDGHPLYTFKDDKKAGDVTGDGQDDFHVASDPAQ